VPEKGFRERLQHAWNVLNDRDQTLYYPTDLGPSYATRPDLLRLTGGSERSIVSSVYTRIAIDVAAVGINHVRTDQNGRFLEVVNSGLNNCLTVEANIDQSGRAFIQDVVLSMFNKGTVAIVPVDKIPNSGPPSTWDIGTVRTGTILDWYPANVRLNVYNDRRGIKQDIVLSKKDVGIIENPLYAVMNESNSTLQRLITKLNQLDTIDQQSSSGKLDLIIQLPYVIKTPLKREQAEIRRSDIEAQLKGSKYGIAYTDATEKITQLNRPAENNLMTQIEYLTAMLYGQLGLTESIFDGTADEKTMNNYYSRTVEPILGSIAGSLRRSFLTKTARSQGQSIMYFRNLFNLITTSELATSSESFTRSAVLSSNDVRSIIGVPPSSDPEADKLTNKNVNPTTTSSKEQGSVANLTKGVTVDGENQNNL
jgi:hypothetical protein